MSDTLFRLKTVEGVIEKRVTDLELLQSERAELDQKRKLEFLERFAALCNEYRLAVWPDGRCALRVDDRDPNADTFTDETVLHHTEEDE